MSEAAEREEHAEKPQPRWVKALLAFAVLVTAVVVLGRLLVFEPFRSPTSSMFPAFSAGDWIVVFKRDKTPARGKVLAFHLPQDPDQIWAKRVVAIAGDTIEIRHGRPVVDGWEVPRCELGPYKFTEETNHATHSGTLSVEFLGASTYLVFDDRSTLQAPGEGRTWTVGPGGYFVVGDNRENSFDSRVWWKGRGGDVAESATIGRVRVPASPTLPEGAESLAPKLADCLAKRPAQTEPPPK